MNVSISLSSNSFEGGAVFFPRPLPLPRPTTFLPRAPPLMPRPLTPDTPLLATPLTILPPRPLIPEPLLTILPPRGRDMEALRPLLPTEADLQ